MATLVEYLDGSDILKVMVGAYDLTPIGYLKIDPPQALRELLLNFYVADYLGISIPSRSRYINCNQGLRISHAADGIGLIGTIDMLNQNDLFKECSHETFSDKQRRQLTKTIKSSLIPLDRYHEPLPPQTAEKYSLIFEILGFPISAAELIKFTTHENYFDPIPNRGILMPEDLPKFP